MTAKSNEEDVSLQEDALLSEEPDHGVIIERTTSGSDIVTASILQSLTQLNTNMAAMGESLKLLHTKGETLTPTTAESARKRKSSSARDVSETEESDADKLLDANKRPRVVGNESSGSTCEDSAEMTKAIPCWMKSRSRSLTRRKLPRRQTALGQPLQPVIQEVDSTSLEETNRPSGPEITSDIITTLSTTQVSEYEAILPSLLEYFQERTRTFKAGSLAAYSHIWHELTSDPEILETVTGQHIELDTVPMQEKPLMQTKLSDIQTESVDLEIAQLLKKGVVQPSKHEAGEFISTIFTRPKKDGSHRMILNLKSFNANVTHYHFKMDNIWSAIRLMKPGCYMASIDLKDAYYTVPICKEHQKFLKFKWKGSLYQFVCFPNGLALCPRKFTKLLKPIFSCLRQQGHISVAYIDDSWLTADNFTLCLRNVIDTTTLLDKVVFIVHPEKSVLLPTQRITFLGFVLDSILMQVSLTPERALKLKNACENLLATASPCIRDVAQVLGLMTSSFPGVMYGPLHHKFLEMDKTQALKTNKGNFDKNMSLSPEAITDLKWWVSKLDTTYNLINHGDPQVTMTTDASLIGWGAVWNQLLLEETGLQKKPSMTLIIWKCLLFSLP
ncbi:hypothetical protein ACROYT_G014230 [Oculina patagonica]